MAVQFSEKSSERIRHLLSHARGGRVLVLGSGVTGQAVSRLLLAADYQVTVVDENAVRADLRSSLESAGARVVADFTAAEDGAKLLDGQSFRFAVSSPGISPDGALFQFCMNAGIPLLSEVDLAVVHLGHPQVAVTGTNGKTTTVHLIHEMFRASGLDTALIGNVGNPFVNLIEPGNVGRKFEPLTENHLVAELSSYQLETAQSFAPQIGVILNIQPDHLERHGSIEEYIAAKGRIFGEQTQAADWSLIFADDVHFRELKALVRGRYMPFGMSSPERREMENCCWYRPVERDIFLKINGSVELFELAQFKLMGACNRFNLAAAVAAARLGGATHEAVQQVINNFRPLDHRLELVPNAAGKHFINDSKATNIHSTLAALEAVRSEFPEGDIVLLLGGLAKTCDWADLLPALSSRVRHVITFGASGDKISAELSGLLAREKLRVLLHRSGSLADATEHAHSLSRAGDVILMAPACASFDAYSNYAERGRDFRTIVGQIAGLPLNPTSLGAELAACR